MVKVAAVQMCSGMSVERNVASMERLVREAHAAGAVYVQTPEMTGALMRDKTGLRAILRPEATDLVAAGASSLARELGIHVHVGSTAILLDDGRVVIASLDIVSRWLIATRSAVLVMTFNASAIAGLLIQLLILRHMQGQELRQTMVTIGLSIVNTRAAGIDIGSRIQVAAVPPELSEDPVQTFMWCMSRLFCSSLLARNPMDSAVVIL